MSEEQNNDPRNKTQQPEPHKTRITSAFLCDIERFLQCLRRANDQGRTM